MRVIAAFLVNTLCNFAIGLLVAKFLGPEQFGRFALALAVAMVLQTAGLDWIRLSSIRFYSERTRQERPELRATLDLTFALIACALAAVTLVLMVSGLDLTLSNALIGLAVGVAIVNGLFDYNTALVRARFHDQLYGRLILTKNLMALVATAGGAYATGSAAVAVAGVCISMAGSIVLFREALTDHDAVPALASRKLAVDCMRYAMPIVAANLLYLMIALVNRSLITRWYGFAETGQFSLAFDLGTRVVASIGTMLDVLLFQMAVRAEETHGIDEGRMQVARNMAVVTAILLPTCAGAWLVIPSIESIIVPADYRGPFATYFSLLIAGLFGYGIINFAINPVFQIAKRTAPMIGAAVIACVADPVIIYLLPQEARSLAIAQSATVLVGMFALVVFAKMAGARWPRSRDMLLSLVATTTMVACVWPIRQAMTPGLLALIVQVSIGFLIYGLFTAVFDIAGLREILVDFAIRIRARIAQRQTAL